MEWDMDWTVQSSTLSFDVDGTHCSRGLPHRMGMGAGQLARTAVGPGPLAWLVVGLPTGHAAAIVDCVLGRGRWRGEVQLAVLTQVQNKAAMCIKTPRHFLPKYPSLKTLLLPPIPSPQRFRLHRSSIASPSAISALISNGVCHTHTHTHTHPHTSPPETSHSCFQRAPVNQLCPVLYLLPTVPYAVSPDQLHAITPDSD